MSNINLPPKEELRERAVDGMPISQSDASAIASAERKLTDGSLIKGGPAATAQSLHDKEQNFLERADDIAHKPADQITKEDAAAIQRAEARLVGSQPGKGSTAAAAQSLADRNAAQEGRR